MRVLPALAAMVSALAAPFRRAKRTVIEAPLRDAIEPMERRFSGVARLLQVRRGRSKPGRPGRGFLRAIQHAVMREPEISADPIAAHKWCMERKRARQAAR